MSESIWQSPFLKGESNPDSKFLKLKDGESAQLQWTDIAWQEQSEKTPEELKTPDGRILNVTFKQTMPDGSVKEKWFTARSNRNMLLVAMKNAGIEMNDRMTVLRKGSGISDTEYIVQKIDPTNPLNDVSPTSPQTDALPEGF